MPTYPTQSERIRKEFNLHAEQAKEEERQERLEEARRLTMQKVNNRDALLALLDEQPEEHLFTTAPKRAA